MNVVPILPQPVAIIPCPFHEQMKAHVMDEVDTINLFLADRFKPKNKTEFLFGDYLLKK